MLRLAVMLAREALTTARVERCPEPEGLMDGPGQAEAFHAQGAEALVPVYHFNALAVSRMTPRGGVVVDLGCGSGRFLAYLAERRPDLRIIGFDLARTMVDIGNRFLGERGLARRVQLVLGDMTNLADKLEVPADLVSSVFSLHHLPTERDLRSCLEQMRRLRERRDCGLWIFDHARPRHPATRTAFPQIFTPEAPDTFNEDSSNSLSASYSYGELRSQLEAVGLGQMQSRRSHWMRLYQAHWVEAAAQGPRGSWQVGSLPKRARHQFEALRRLFPGVPLDLNE